MLCKSCGRRSNIHFVNGMVGRPAGAYLWDVHCVSEVQGGRMVDLTERPLEVGSLAHETCSDDDLGVRE